MKKIFLILLSLMFISLLVAETMMIHLTSGETIDFVTSEIQEITFDPNVSVEEMVEFISQIPIRFLKNYPNPFNPTTTISFEINQCGKTKVEIFNVKGQKVKTLLNEELDVGVHNIVWKGIDEHNKKVANGVYFYKVKVNKEEKINKMIMLK